MENIDLVNKTMYVKKQIPDRGGSVKEFQLSTPKTKSSIRTPPLNKMLLNDLKPLKEEVSKEYGFNDDYFVIGDAFPVASNTINQEKIVTVSLLVYLKSGSMTLVILVHLYLLIMVLI